MGQYAYQAIAPYNHRPIAPSDIFCSQRGATEASSMWPVIDAINMFLILEWTTSLDTSSSTLFVCRGPGTGDCVQRDLSPTSGYTGISARRRYAIFFYLQSVSTRSLSTLVG